MTFMRKILDALNMENWNANNSTGEKKYFNPNSEDNYETYVSKIKDYWLKTNCASTDIRYRTTSFKEKQKFALIDVLSSFSTGAKNPDDFSTHILSEIGITNWNHYFKTLLRNNYVQQANITETLIANHSLNDLKIIADSIGVKKSGKKAELAERISHSLAPNQINQILGESNLYSIAENGKQLLIDNEDYVLFHKYRHMISLAEFNDNRFPDGVHSRNFYDTMFQALSNRLFFYESSHNWEQLCITHINIYNLLMDEAKKTNHTIHYDVILCHYLEFLYLSTCFCRSMCYAVKDKIFSNSLGRYTLPQPDTHIYQLADYEPSVNYEFIFCNKPPSLLTNEEFISFVHELLNAPMFNKGKWDNLLQKRARDLFNLIK